MSDDEYECMKYFQYFQPEIDQINSKSKKDQNQKIDIEDDFEKKREMGENDNYILPLIRNDCIDIFITVFNEENIDLDTKINPSIFETNITLITNKLSLIEYTAYFGSFNIFKFCQENGSKIDLKILKYAIHGRNKKIIKFLLTNKIVEITNYKEFIEESIKCHHNEIALLAMLPINSLTFYVANSINKLSIFKVLYFDESAFYEKFEKNEFINDFIENAASNVLPNIPESFPFII